MIILSLPVYLVIPLPDRTHALAGLAFCIYNSNWSAGYFQMVYLVDRLCLWKHSLEFSCSVSESDWLSLRILCFQFTWSLAIM